MARPRGNRWQGDAEYNGKRVRKSFKLKEEAELWEAQMRLADTQGAPAPEGRTSKSGSDFTLGGFSDKHFNFLWGANASPKNNERNLKHICEIIGYDTPLREVTYAAITDMVSELQRQGNANSTINRKMATLSKLMKHARKLGQVDTLPEFPRFKESNGRIRFFTKEEERKIVGRLEHLGLIESMHLTNFLLYTGFRRSEAHAVEKRDVDKKHKTVTIWETKADHPRTIPITPPVMAAVEYCENHNKDQHKLFSVSYDAYTDHWNRVRHDLGYGDDPQFVIHTLRHTCASRLVQAGIDLRRVQTYMGHKAIATTLRYSHLAPTDLDIAAQALIN